MGDWILGDKNRPGRSSLTHIKAGLVNFTGEFFNPTIFYV